MFELQNDGDMIFSPQRNKNEDMSDKAKIAMDTAIWNHGRKKAMITEAISKLKRTTLADHPDVKNVIVLLEVERERLKKVELF